MRIRILKDPCLKPLPDYTADDVAAMLDARGQPHAFADQSALERLDRRDCDLLVLPYVQGNFSEVALGGLARFHEQGGSLLFLGDLPNRDAWYPLRNMQSWRLHLTRCGDGVRIAGLTDFGRRVIGELKDPKFFAGRSLPGLRVTAYPPDETHPLLAIESNDHAVTSRSVVCVTRKCERFLGAKLAQLGFNGGEPRENVAGVYHLDWQFDPGLLTRKWAGIDDLVWKLSNWLEPDRVAGAIELTSVYREGEAPEISVLLRNLTDKPVQLQSVRFLETGRDRPAFESPVLQIPAGQIARIPARIAPRPFGIHRYRLTAVVDGMERTLAEATERVVPADGSRHVGFGASTFWAFQTRTVPEEYKHFIRELLRRGCQYIRAAVPWEDVEPEPGRYDWSIPDQLAAFAEQEEFKLLFWMFPTTRGSGLGECGVPQWTLREAAVDRDGKKGNFPTLWSPFYREHYFGMIREFTKRFAGRACVKSFVLDFGNSDFPYGYYYYVNDPTLFDYSEHEQRAFRRYLIEQRGLSLEDVGRLYGRAFVSIEEVPVPLAAKDAEAWRAYLDFRAWTIHGGIKQAMRVCAERAPAQVPPDFPGHGLGSIADLSAYFCEAKARHWDEERKFDPKHTEMHNAGRQWGGEAWQVGGDYRQYDDALFQSVRLNATYYTIPGPDLGLFGDDIARNGFIRRTLMGATRREPELAVIDSSAWNDWPSLANVAARLDQGAALLCRTHRFDFSCYRLLALRPDELQAKTATVGTGGSLLPADESWYWLLRECVGKGMHLLVFPNSCQAGRTSLPLTFLRQVMDLLDVKYGELMDRSVKPPDSFGAGILKGRARSVRADGTVLLRDSRGEPVLIQRPFGKGSLLLAGYDGSVESFDGEHRYDRDAGIGGHTLARLCGHLGILPREVRTGQAYIYKEMVHRGDKDYLLLFSHLPKTVEVSAEVRLGRPSKSAFDLATGERFHVADIGDSWYRLQIPVHTRAGRYLSFHD
jgi:hypothetical protein